MKTIIIAIPAGVHYSGIPGEYFINGALRPVMEVDEIPPFVTDTDTEAFITRLAARPGGLRVRSDDTQSQNGARVVYGDLVVAALDSGVDLPESDLPARRRQLERDERRVLAGHLHDAELAQADDRLRRTLSRPMSEFMNLADRLKGYKDARALLG